ncbi:MAG: Glutamyl-Q tRNA(Asp) synthetase, partial [Pseudomonadota bacterium]
MHRGRFAPTPSGELHMGSLVCALASFLDVKKRGGEWLVRIEDVDALRCRTEFEYSILRELERHGLQWDGSVVRQSEREELYLDCLKELEQRGLVFRCFCSRASLRSSGYLENCHGELIYPGLCRSRSDGQQRSYRGMQSSLRFAIGSGQYQFDDLIHGAVSGDVALEVGDFVVRRADGYIA